MKIGVTGATGFIGRSVLAKSNDGKHQVVPLVRRASNLPSEHVIGDIAFPLKAALPTLDAVIHLAGLAQRPRGDPETAKQLIHSANVDGTRHVLDASIAAGVTHFTLVSSIKVHSEKTEPGRLLRETDICEPQDIYGASKKEAERLVIEKCSEAGISYTIIRPPIVYGAGVGGNFGRLAALARLSIPIPLGSINNARSMLYVENLADFILITLQHDAAKESIFLVSDGDDVSTSDLLRALGKVQNRTVRLIPAKPLQFALKLLGLNAWNDSLFGNLQIDGVRAQQCLNWVPPYDLKAGLNNSFRNS
jgi:UDP-glucose 4-epimerase